MRRVGNVFSKPSIEVSGLIRRLDIQPTLKSDAIGRHQMRG
jgi:hypothetical protein